MSCVFGKQSFFLWKLRGEVSASIPHIWLTTYNTAFKVENGMFRVLSLLAITILEETFHDLELIDHYITNIRSLIPFCSGTIHAPRFDVKWTHPKIDLESCLDCIVFYALIYTGDFYAMCTFKKISVDLQKCPDRVCFRKYSYVVKSTEYLT